MVEAGDFGMGTSSRSTKLLHGGVRYLELALKERDPGSFAWCGRLLRNGRWSWPCPPSGPALTLLTPLFRP
ncbi:hypothetical protein AN926_05960, partial [Thermus scotoductus]